MKRLILLIFLFMVACGKPSGKMSILERSNCKLPCWNGIIAGQTTEGEFLRTLENLPDVDPESIENTNQAWNIFDDQIHFSFRQSWSLDNHPRLRGYADLTDNIVSALMFCGELNTTMGLLVESVGEPEHIISGNDIGGGRTVILTQSQKGVSFSYTTELSNLEITEDTQIDCVEFFDPSLYEKMLAAKMFSSGYYNAEETMKAWYVWDGYGNLDEKYPPRQP